MATGLDYSAATRFGAIRPITTGSVPVFRTEDVLNQVTKSLIHSTKDDFLIISGGSTVAALTLTAWILLHDECKLLLYDITNGEYIIRVISKQDIILRFTEVQRELSMGAKGAR